MKKYRTKCGDSIECFEVVKETKHQILFKQLSFNEDYYIRRETKESNYNAWFDTFDEAKQYLIDKQKKEIEIHYLAIATAKRTIEKIELLQDNFEK